MKKISLTREKIFVDADVYTAVFLFERNNNIVETNENFILTTTELERIKQGEEINYARVKQARFKEIQGKVWNILINETNILLINKIIGQSKPLAEIGTLNRGLITGDRSKYFSSTPLNNKYKPILAGSDVFRYYVNSVSEYVLFERPKTEGGCWMLMSILQNLLKI